MASSLSEQTNPRSISRNWCFTTNNYVRSWDVFSKIDGERRLQRLIATDDPVCSYIVFGLESAPTTGTLHLQGFISFSSEKSRRQVVAALAKIDPAPSSVRQKSIKSTFTQAIVYCKKDGVFFEYGVAPLDKEQKGQKSAQNFRAVITAAENNNLEVVRDDNPGIYLRHYSTLQTIAAHNLNPATHLAQSQVYFLHGKSGSGKSHLARALDYSVYDKSLNRWWDGFNQSRDIVTVIEELDPENIQPIGFFLKRWTDRYSFTCELKCGTKSYRPAWIFITSQYSLPVLCGKNVELLAALTRRCTIHEITHANRDILRASIKAHIDGVQASLLPPPLVANIISNNVPVAIGSPEIDPWDEVLDVIHGPFMGNQEADPAYIDPAFDSEDSDDSEPGRSG